MSEFDELDVLVAIRDVGVDPLALDRLDQRFARAFSETPRLPASGFTLDTPVA